SPVVRATGRLGRGVSRGGARRGMAAHETPRRIRRGAAKSSGEAWSALQFGAAGIGGSRRDRRACSRARKLDAGGWVTRPKGIWELWEWWVL
ncbi:MAG: hypothetical protein WCK89_08555, partial [bacterium]